MRPSYNIAPTDPVFTVRTRSRDGRRVLSAARWGLVPTWAADRRGAAARINARAETVATTPAFRSAFARRRCLVPADGWFEWTTRPDRPGKQPVFLTPRDGGGLAFAGLWEVWGDPPLLTVTIVTVAATGDLLDVHHRMPLVLPADRYAAWLDPAIADPTTLLAPDPVLVSGLEIRPVGPRVGPVRNDGPDLVERVDPTPAPATLF